MRLKLDENLDARLAAILTEAGHDVSSVRAQRLQGHPDKEIYTVCLTEKRALIAAMDHRNGTFAHFCPLRNLR